MAEKAKPVTIPIATPPTKSTVKDPAASTSENAPVTAAAYGELECNDAGCVVNQRLSREKRLLAMGQVDVGLKRGDGGCIGWPQGRGQRKRRS